MTGIVSYGCYLPRHRLDRAEIASTLRAGGGSGTRSVAGHDEDTTTMAVEAGRRALGALDDGAAPGAVAFTTALPSYLEKTNAAAIHAALGLDPGVDALDCVGSPRSVWAAWLVASAHKGLAIASDIRFGRPGSGDESAGGDGAVALAFGDDAEAVAVEVGGATVSAELMDRWRLPASPFVEEWEERFGEAAYAPIVARAVGAALDGVSWGPDGLDHVIVAGSHGRAVRAARRSIKGGGGAEVDDLSGSIGNTGSAHAWLMLASVLDTADPEETIAVVTLADGCTVRLLRTTDRVVSGPSRGAFAAATSERTLPVAYADVLTWRGLLDRQPPRRPEPVAPAAPPAYRSAAWKYGFAGSVDESGNVHVPPSRVSLQSGSVDRMEAVRLADRQGTIAAFTIDHLAYSLSPPVVVAIVDLDGGGRLQCELTDADPGALNVGDRVEMTFRRLHTRTGIHNYFWKARPAG